MSNFYIQLYTTQCCGSGLIFIGSGSADLVLKMDLDPDPTKECLFNLQTKMESLSVA